MSFNQSLYQSCLIIVLGLFSINHSFALTCRDSESLKILLEQENYRSALQNIDSCLSARQQISTNDLHLFNQLIKQVLIADNSISFNDGYRNFQAVLNIHLLESLAFKLKSHFEKYPKKATKLFSKVRDKGEKYYFYYDTGRMLSYKRGFALTKQSLIWKNITGQPHRLAFNDINSIKLIYKPGLSLTNWKLMINNKAALRLSKVPDNAIIPFVSAMIYFINLNKTVPDKVQFLIPEIEMAILAGWKTLCSYKELEQGSPIKELQLLDACFSYYGKKFKLSHNDSKLLKKLTNSIFEKSELPFDTGYNHFKVVLSTHFFQKLDFQFQNHLNTQTIAKLFKAVRLPAENYYFYFDTGIVISESRGIALTDKAIIWKNLLGTSISGKNLTGSASRLAFDKISSVTLKPGFKFNRGWKLRLNQQDEIILSQLSEENAELFASALVYFINIASSRHLTLQIEN
ncbi:MAG: hypothetical protein DRQ49_06815 [Gammaproteobacteria bacterium]|nr:MAG: hypothetical protein DRQ49_06815 [Gammaproteobacteria bacterium]RKZ43910.1 MAG: hypothetical protein DRQ41_04140 [Gammaproteobacteria bacterium]